MGIQKDQNGVWSWPPKSAPPSVGGPAGWFADPENPGLERYWSGEYWHPDMAPRPAPQPAWKQARIIALGILMALAVLIVLDRLL